MGLFSSPQSCGLAKFFVVIFILLDKSQRDVSEERRGGGSE